ncbi:MAG: hypothetical protein IJI85_04715 [Clostridia bacterium]|nr:hypothetical protein [Clostridia bacterium]
MCLELNDIENAVLSAFSGELLIDVDYINELSDYELFRSYVNQLFTCYVQDLVTGDILALNKSSDDWPEMLIDEVGNCGASVSEEICKMYYEHRSQFYFDQILSDLRQEAK